jgi:hypothetical protein
MPTPYSPEGRILTGLTELGCSQINCVKISAEHGIKISTFVLSQALADIKPLSTNLAERLLDIIDQMKRLKAAVEAPLMDDAKRLVSFNWGDTEKISNILTVRRIASIANEFGDSTFDQFAVAATKSVK